MAYLVPLNKYLRAIGAEPGDNDTMHLEAIEDASAAILAYTDRDFGTEAVTEDRTYRYDNSGILNIDDATEVNSVAIDGRDLTSTTWTAWTEGPAGAPYTWLQMPTRLHGSPEMGFTYNLDRLWDRSFAVATVATVNADWGYTPVPADVQRAVIWTASAYEQQSETFGGAIASESVAEVTRSYIQQAGNPALDITDLPPRAKAILDQYRRVSL